MNRTKICQGLMHLVYVLLLSSLLGGTTFHYQNKCLHVCLGYIVAGGTSCHKLPITLHSNHKNLISLGGKVETVPYSLLFTFF